MLEVTITCPKCHGTGIYERGSVVELDGILSVNPCPMWNGDKILIAHHIDIEEIITELDWIKKKIKKILNKLELPEN